MKLTKITSTLLGSFGLVTFLTGCSSVLCGSHQSVNVDSFPQGAKVMIYDSNGKVVFEDNTPCVADLKRGAAGSMGSGQYTVVLNKDGYSPAQVNLSGVVNRAYVLNALNIIGLAVDPITGAMWTLDPAKVNENLATQNAAFFKGKQGLMICLKQDVPQDLQQYLTPVKD